MYHGGPIPYGYGDALGASAASALYSQQSTAADVASGQAKAAAAGLTTAASMLTVAGGVATIPVAGWIAGAVTAAAAGVVALVASIKKGKISKANAVEYAKQLGLSNPEAVPGFVTRALGWSQSKVEAKLASEQKTYARLRRRGSHKSGRGRKLHTKIELLKGILAVQRDQRKAQIKAELQAKLGPSVSSNQLEAMAMQAAAPPSELPVIPILVGTAILGLGWLALSSRKRGAK